LKSVSRVGNQQTIPTKKESTAGFARESNINYLRRKIDVGTDRLLIRTIRGVGYQIGGNHYPR
jgi:DNA-binding response OmpR family regulator